VAPETLRTAGTLLLFIPAVVFGGASLLWHWITKQTTYYENPLRRQLWRAGHAHAGVLLILSLLALLFVDQTALSDQWKSVVRWTSPSSAILVPSAFFLSVVRPDVGASQPTRQPGLPGGNPRERRNRRTGHRTPERLKAITRYVPIWAGCEAQPGAPAAMMAGEVRC
jgi:hypothetical protein